MINFSLVLATNDARPEITRTCYNSWIDNMTVGDELIIVGEYHDSVAFQNPSVVYIEQKEWASKARLTQMRMCGVKSAKNKWILHIDDDVLFSPEFLNRARRFIANKNPKHFTTKTFTPTGGRFWDRSIYTCTKEDLLLASTVGVNNSPVPIGLEHVDYDYEGNNLWYNGTLIFVTKELNLKISFEGHQAEGVSSNTAVYGGWEILWSIALAEQGHKITIDKDNYFFHYNYAYKNVININNGREIDQAHRGEHPNIVFNEKRKRMFEQTVKMYK